MQPNSPEARRAAQKVKNGFMFLAALNLVLIAVAVWPSKKAPQTETAPPPATESPTGQNAADEMNRVFDAAMNAWEHRDAKAFYAQFATAYVPADSVAVFDRLFLGVYADEFGAITTKTLVLKESNGDPDFGMLVFNAECTKHPKARLSANFIRENGQLKLAQIRMEKLEPR